MEVTQIQDSTGYDMSTFPFQVYGEGSDDDLGGHKTAGQAEHPSSGCQVCPPNAGLGRSSFPPSRRDWEAHREPFTRLYQVEEQSLKEAMEIMRDRYQFRATVKMYKTKIREWHLEKNYKASEKQAVLELLDSVEPSGSSNIRIDIRGRPAKMHRIVRYSKAQGMVKAGAIRSVLSNESSPNTSGHDMTRHEHQEALARWQQYHNTLDGPTPASTGDGIHSFRAREEPFLPLPAPQNVEDAEQTLFEIRDYFRAYFSPGERSRRSRLLRCQPFFGQSILSDIVDIYDRACHEAANSNYQKARIHLNRAHRQLHLATRVEHSQLLGTIFTIISTPSNNPSFETAHLFGSFAADISRAVFGSDHPVTKAIQRYRRISATVAIKEEFVHQFRLMRLQVAQAALGKSWPDSEGPTVMRCHSLDDPQYAKKLQEAVYNYDSQYEPDYARLLSASHDWAGFHLRGISDSRIAEQGFKGVLVRTQGACQTTTACHARLRALKGMVVIADRQGRWNEGESLCREALDLGINALGQGHYYTRRLAEWLVDLVAQQGRDDEARQIAEDHGLEVEAAPLLRTSASC